MSAAEDPVYIIVDEATWLRLRLLPWPQVRLWFDLWVEAFRTGKYAARLPHDADPESLAALVAAGEVTLTDDGIRYRHSGADATRERQNEWHRQGGRARAAGAPREGGRFTSSHQQPPTGAGAAGGGDDRYGTVRGSPAGTSRHQHDVDVDDDDDVETTPGGQRVTAPPGGLQPLSVLLPPPPGYPVGRANGGSRGRRKVATP